MNERTLLPMRKRLMTQATPHADSGTAINLAACATVLYSSEDADHPVENIVDEHTGRGGTFWSSEQPDTVEQLLVEFDTPQPIARLVYEVEETRSEKTQEVRIEASEDGGQTYRGVLTQNFVFSPGGATFQREDLPIQLRSLTHLRLTIRLNKGGTGKATLTSLRLYR